MSDILQNSQHRHADIITSDDKLFCAINTPYYDVNALNFPVDQF